MRLFSKIAFLCNICFIVAAMLRLVELGMRSNGNNNAIIPLPFIEGTIVILGLFISVFLNIFFLISVLFLKISKQPVLFSKFLLWFNIILLPVQIFYFFFWNK